MGYAALNVWTKSGPTWSTGSGEATSPASSLATLKSALGALKDNPNFSPEDRSRFLDLALDATARIQHALDDRTVECADAPEATSDLDPAFAARVVRCDSQKIVEIDFSDLTFKNDADVNSFYDVIEHAVGQDGERWWLVVNYRGHGVWPEAWVAAQHRARKIALHHAHGVIRYDDGGAENAAPRRDGMLASREDALAEVERLKVSQ